MSAKPWGLTSPVRRESSLAHRGWLGLLATVALGFGAPAVAASGFASSGAGLQPLVVPGVPSPGHHASHPLRPAPVPRRPALPVSGQFYSSNWGGFIDGAQLAGSALSSDQASFDAVSSSWAVPALQPSPPNSYEASWAGIGGVFGSQALLQAGSIEYFQGRRQVYLAFVEDYPNPALAVNDPLRAGDQLSVSVAESDGVWTVDVTDQTAGWSTGPLNMASIYARFGYAFVAPDQGTAEWIVEDPACGSTLCSFANFTPETFSPVQDVASTAVSRTPLESIIVNAQGVPQVSISPASIGSTSTAAASYSPFTVARAGGAGPARAAKPAPPAGPRHG